MMPSEFFLLLPEVTPALLGLREVGIDDSDDAQALVDGLLASALLDFELLTGHSDEPVETGTQQQRRERQAFLSLLNAAALRLKKYQTGMNAVEAHNPDVQQNVAFNLDLVRVIGRAERAAMQRARKLIRGDGWLSRLVSSA